MNPKPAIRAEAARLFAAFQAAGAVPVDADILLPAETLLDLYGEDIRARAYVTTDPLQGEMMLRPDFTVPVVQQHMAHGADPARYCYMGEVFRSSDTLANRDSEYLQVGFEVFDRNAPEQADAEVFALFAMWASHPELRGLHDGPAQGGTVAAYLAAPAVSRPAGSVCRTGPGAASAGGLAGAARLGDGGGFDAGGGDVHRPARAG